ncbi:MAG: hypothetical protein O2818_00435 [Bacteroidetes bacterium]|jgi:hypothetical protein|nr:hypothetical protein [Bacteroidota bacterium]MDA1335329.1 hypothetical protein [Bacteroidota bacterium]
MAGVLEILSMILMSIIKFVVTPSIMVARGFSIVETFVVTTVGASIGVLLFFYFGKWITAKIEHRRSGKAKKKRIFTPSRRRLVRFMKQYGIWGLLGICGIISVPIASMVAAKYFERDPRMPWILILAFGLWSLMLTGISFWATW